MEHSTPLLTFENVSKDYSRGRDLSIPVLNKIHFALYPKEYLSIMGPSGSGKSTLLNLLGFLDHPTEGSIYFRGQNVASLPDDELSRLRNRTIGFIFQSFNLFPQMDALTNVEVPMLYAGLPLRERRERARDLLQRMNLSHRLHHRPNQLSGGEQQRVAIARALSNNPDFLLADEPTGNLDKRSGQEIVSLLHELHTEGKTLVVVTHNPEIASQAQRQLHMNDGRLDE